MPRMEKTKLPPDNPEHPENQSRHKPSHGRAQPGERPQGCPERETANQGMEKHHPRLHDRFSTAKRLNITILNIKIKEGGERMKEITQIQIKTLGTDIPCHVYQLISKMHGKVISATTHFLTGEDSIGNPIPAGSSITTVTISLPLWAVEWFYEQLFKIKYTIKTCSQCPFKDVCEDRI